MGDRQRPGPGLRGEKTASLGQNPKEVDIDTPDRRQRNLGGLPKCLNNS